MRASPAALVALAVMAVAAGCGGSIESGADLGQGPGTTAPATTVATTVPPPPTTTTLPPPVEAPALPLAGCPPPARPPAPPPPPYVPPRLVPEEELPTPQAPAAWTSNLAPLEGKGMWLWLYRRSEGGNPDAIVERAVQAGLRQLWVRVGDSKDQFYARDVLEQLVPRAHRRGIAVIGWGFPFLFDPVADARWATDVLNWRSSGGETLDGFSPDLELATEGVAVSEKRTTVFLDLVRRAAGSRLVVATVYRPTDRLWPTGYHYAAIAPYVDAFAPMVYWNCTEPGAATVQSIERLKTLRPVHAIGQAYDASESYSRMDAPNAHEIRRFLDTSRRQGALGASFWVWHLAEPEHWEAVSAFPWPRPG
jgi:hypothetical protein